jgi:hypothetical protein
VSPQAFSDGVSYGFLLPRPLQGRIYAAKFCVPRMPVPKAYLATKLAEPLPTLDGGMPRGIGPSDQRAVEQRAGTEKRGRRPDEQ